MSRSEEGAAVVIALGLMSLLITVGIVSGGVVALFAAHRQAQTAADLAVLAGAAAAQSGGLPCDVADQVAGRNGSRVVRCTSDGSTVAVVVERRLVGLLGGRSVRARARAGPVLQGEEGFS